MDSIPTHVTQSNLIPHPLRLSVSYWWFIVDINTKLSNKTSITLQDNPLIGGLKTGGSITGGFTTRGMVIDGLTIGVRVY